MGEKPAEDAFALLVPHLKLGDLCCHMATLKLRELADLPPPPTTKKHACKRPLSKERVGMIKKKEGFFLEERGRKKTTEFLSLSLSLFPSLSLSFSLFLSLSLSSEMTTV